MLYSGEVVGEDAVPVSTVPNTQPEQSVCLVRRFNTMCICLTDVFVCCIQVKTLGRMLCSSARCQTHSLNSLCV